MKRIAMAGFVHETNTFSPVPTTYESFATRSGPLTGIVDAEEMLLFKDQRFNSGCSGFFAAGEKLGFEIFPLLYTGAEPSAAVSMDAFDRIMDQLLEKLEKMGPFDGVFLDLHGAMVLEGYRDGETEILKRIRKVVGDIPITASLDLHGNITPESFELADALVGCRTYPHEDFFETGERCAALMDARFQGKTLYKTFKQIPFLPMLSTTSTYVDPARSVYAAIDEAEKDSAVLCAVVMEGFPPADAEFCGPTVFAYAENAESAEKAASYLEEVFLAHEGDFRSDLPGPKEAVARAVKLSETADKPVILADGLDNPGGGSTSDTPWLLEALLNQDVPESALGLMVDPEAARQAFEVGEGTQVTLDLGGKLMEGQNPVHALFEVVKLHEGEFPGTGPLLKGMPMDLGKMAHLKKGNVHVVVVSERMQAADQSFFRIVGIEPSEMKILVLKSSNHFRADFQPISSEIIYVEAPAAMIEDPAKVGYRNLRPGMRLGGKGPAFQP